MSYSDLLLYQVPFRLGELLVALGVVFIVALRSATTPESSLINIVHHRHRAWLAFGFFLLPMFVARSYWFWRVQLLPGTSGGFEFQWLISLGLSLVYGIAMGMVGCLLAATGNREEKFKALQAAGIALAVICLMAILQELAGPFGAFRRFYVTDILAALIFLTFVIARVSAKKNPAPAGAGLEPNQKGAPALALTLGFLPSAMLLLLLPAVPVGQPPSAALLIICCGLSVVCCFAASFLLFRRGTGLAIFGGILFICLNAFVSFLFGCGAMLTGMKF